ncbi:rhodanese-like domain-containing protein [Arthrospiribacter ruber]|nr:rhodanese-like domain-containing protein [Arthrospiribacter ruber]
MKRFFLIILILFSSAMVWGQSLAYKTLLKGVYDKEFPLVYPEDKILTEEVLFLDTREISEFEVSHIKDAKWVGYDTFSLNAISEIPKNKDIVVYCSIGARSQEIGKKLKEAGYQNVYNLYGGIFHWVNEGHPVFDEHGKTNRVHAYSKTWGIWLNKGDKVY